MLYQSLNYQKTDKVMIVSIMGPVDSQVKIARLSDELTELSDRIIRDDEIWVIVLTGAGEKSFSMETDSLGPNLEGDGELGTKTWSLAEPLGKLDLPIMAAINGDAIGQGLELVLACDIRIASETSHFGLAHIRTGHIPWDGGTQRLSRLVGKSNALEMILTGEIIDAQEAYRIGLINRVVSPRELLAWAQDTAQKIASRGPIALKYAKEAIYKGMDLTLEQGLRLEADLYLLLHTTRDRAEGIQAFRKKRVPEFEGK
ncbi:MAG: enoyl-CoA hydratase/isomerase family protein [Deltaproteobacteria bacterium]|nr:enoyl-CoA hydratase/isomerase family protein [Deltaproteobacteria bacterium]